MGGSAPQTPWDLALISSRVDDFSRAHISDRRTMERLDRRIRDEQFFGQAFIDYGAVAWPGEIDLAPDAMCALIAGQRDGPQPVG